MPTVDEIAIRNLYELQQDINIHRLVQEAPSGVQMEV